MERCPVEALISVRIPAATDTLTRPGLTPILGRSSLERQLAHLAESGVRHAAIVVWGAADAAGVATVRRLAADGAGRPVQVTVRQAPDGRLPFRRDEFADQVLVVDGGVVFDPRLYRWVREAEAPVWLVDRSARQRGPADGAAPDEAMWAGMAKLDAEAVARIFVRPGDGGAPAAAALPPDGGHARWLALDALPTYVPALRRHLAPYWCRLEAPGDFRRAERLILDSAQKGVLDFPARFLHPWPENVLARLLSRTGITPNQVTVLTGAVGLVAAYLFAVKAFGWGLAIAFLANVLDGVDGKLARIKLLNSRFGDRLDHVLDVSFEFAWYVGLGWGLATRPGDWLPLRLALGLIGIMLVSRALSGVYRALSGHQIHDHRPFDRAFRLVAGRRNVYVVMLLAGLVLGQFRTAFYAVVVWGAVSATVYLIRTAMAVAERVPSSQSPNSG